MALPQGYEPPKTGSGYYTLSNIEVGSKVKIRILSDFIVGKSVWGDKDGKRVPTRARIGGTIPVSAIGVNQYTGEPERIKQFIAAVVWNYNEERIEVLESDKVTINSAIFELESEEDWGDSKNYDITISKKKVGDKTEYSIIPSNKKKFECPEDYSKVNLDALFNGSDPFSESPSSQSDEVDPEDIPF